MYGIFMFVEMWLIFLLLAQQFGVHVNDAPGPLEVNARIIKPPTLKYGAGSKNPTIVCNRSCVYASF